MKTSIKYDLIIVGAGLVGASLALALKDSGFKILCLDRKPLALKKEKKRDNRPISLAHASICILKNLNFWSELEEFATAITHVHISNQGGFGRLEFKASEHDLPALGYVLPFARLEEALLKKAFHNSHLAYLEIKDISDLNCSESGAKLQVLTENGVEFLETQLIVAADGSHSQVRELLKIEVQQGNSQEIAFTARIHLQKAHTGIAYERFTPNGAFALLPTWDSMVVNLVWTLPVSQWEVWRNKTAEELLLLVQTVFGYRLGKMLSLESMAHYPLCSLLVKKQVDSAAVLLGNAAHSLYPLAAQGFNLGLRDVAVLSEILLAAKQKEESLSALSLLETYQTQRLEDQQAVQNLTSSLHEIFSIKIPGFSGLRSAVLLGIDLAKPLKKNLAKRCLGFMGRVPRLVRGMPWT